MNSFERDTLYRMLVNAVRYWVVGTFLSTKALPKQDDSFWVYPSGATVSLDWGDDHKQDDSLRPLKGKRIRVTLTIEDY